MISRWSDLYSEAREVYRNGGLNALKRGIFRFSRERLPIELYPPLVLDPEGHATKTISLHPTDSKDIRYTGAFPEQLPRQLAALQGKLLGADGVVYVFRDAVVRGRRPLVGINNGYFPPSWVGIDTTYFIYQERSLKRNFPLKTYINRYRSVPEREIETGFLLLGERSHEFSHWHHEVLPKLQWLEEYSRKTGNSPTLIVSADITETQERTLRFLGYDSWITPGTSDIRVNELIIPPHPRRSKGTHHHTVDHRWVADKIQSSMAKESDSTPNRVYISRRDANRRRVKNEDEVIEALQQRGFEWYEPGRLKYEDQVELFAGADIIVGPHGLAFTNLIHAEDCALVELFPERGVTEHYFLTAMELELDYEPLVCEPVNSGQNIRARDSDFIVDVTQLNKRLDVVEED